MDGVVISDRTRWQHAAYQFAVALVVLVSAASSAAQTRVVSEQAVRTAEGVRAFVRVTDADGRPVRADSAGLVALLDGTRRPIAALSSARNAPLAVVFVVCLNRAQRPADVSETVGAMSAFADGLRGAGDRAALVACGDRARIVMPWSAPSDVRRALDALRATDDEANEAEALRLAAALPVTGARRLAVVRTDGRHLDPATEGDLASAGLPVFAMASPGTVDVLPLVTLARTTGGAYLEGDATEVLSDLHQRLRASWQLDIAVTDSVTPSWFSVRAGALTSSRVRVARPPAVAPGASSPGATAPSPAAKEDPGPGVLTWLALGSLIVAAAAGWVFFGRRGGTGLPRATDVPASPEAGPPPLIAQSHPRSLAAPIASADVPGATRPQRTELAAPHLVLHDAGGVVLTEWHLIRPCVVGRSADADLRLSDPSVSALHAEIAFDGRTVRVRDLGSTNGLSVDGQAVREAEIRSGSRLTLGESVVVVTIDVLPSRGTDA